MKTDPPVDTPSAAAEASIDETAAEAHMDETTPIAAADAPVSEIFWENSNSQLFREFEKF